MIVKSFLLRQDKIQSIAALCDKETIAVIRPEKKVEALFRDSIRKTIVEKKTAKDELNAIREYFKAVSGSPVFQEAVNSTLSAVEYYLREGMYVQTSPHAIEDYVMAKCARLCAEAVNEAVGGTLIDGTSLMLCRTQQHFDWAASKKEMSDRLRDLKGPVVIPGGYGRLHSGYVVRVGKDGSHLMSSLIASAVDASCIEFHIEGKLGDGISAITFDEATHYCAGEHRPFASSAIWPAKNANIPIVVKDIDDPSFDGTIISTGSAHRQAVVADKELVLLTVYGTGLLGKVGMSSSIFSAMAGAKVNVRFIAQTSSEYSISFAVRSEDKETALGALKKLFEENPLLPLDDVVVLNQEVGIVTVFGSKMRKVPGVSGQVFGKLGDAGISIIASAQGGEELSISLVLDEQDVEKAVALLK
ncbi:MAG: ACT domain-containing protein [Bacteroidales bacterium]|nr:ACT domain-containing protein [Bacteroidales bacterium]